MARPFRGLNRGAGPLRSYDAVVIGAGVGGLTCANLLAKYGLRVLLVDQHTVVGGYCSTFHRSGYHVRRGQSLLPAARQPGDAHRPAARRPRRRDGLGEDGSGGPVPPAGRIDASPSLRTSTFTFRGSKPSSRTRRRPSTEFFAAARQAYLLGLLALLPRPRRAAARPLPGPDGAAGAGWPLSRPAAEAAAHGRLPALGRAAVPHVVRVRLNAAGVVLPGQLLPAGRVAGVRRRNGPAVRGAGRAHPARLSGAAHRDAGRSGGRSGR